jgi:hypothetical protein
MMVYFRGCHGHLCGASARRQTTDWWARLKMTIAGPIGFARHKAAATFGDPSFAGEAAEISALLARLGLTCGYAVDIAAADGVTQSCTLALFRDQGWSGLAVECDANKFAKLAYAYASFAQVELAKCKVSPDNIVALLQAHGAPRDLHFVNLDIDSYDLFVVKALLAGGFRPRLISMEVNEKLPPPLYFTVLYSPDHIWQEDHFFGCSAVAAAETVRPFGYILAGQHYNNVFFVEAGLAAKAGIEDRDVGVAYASGYRDAADRESLFPWNADVDAALTMMPNNALAFFEEHFRAYRGKYELRLSPR